MDEIRITCKKRKAAGEQDAFRVVCGERTWVFHAWHQGVMPHEMFHYAVEAVWPLRGFVRLVAEGHDPGQITKHAQLRALGEPGFAEVCHAELLTSAMQYEFWGLSAQDDATLEASLREQCEQNGIPLPDLSAERVEECRTLIRDLARQWNALPAGGRLELALPLEPVTPGSRGRGGSGGG